jgi:transposase
MVLLSVQGMDVAGIARVTFTSPGRVREVIRNFSADGFGSLYPRYAGGRPPVFTLPQRQAIKRIALSRPGDHGLAFSAWSLAKLAEFLVAEGVVEDISHEGLRALLRKEEVSFQAIKTVRQSRDPDYEAKKNRVLELYDLAEGKAARRRGDPAVVFCMDEFGPLGQQPRPGRQWAPVIRRRSKGSPASPRRRRRRATCTRTQGVRHLLAALDMTKDKLYGHVKMTKNRTAFLAFCRYLRSLYPPQVRIAIVLDNYSPHLSTRKNGRVGRWAAASNVELAYVPTSASFLNRIECHFAALRYFTLDGTDHRSHQEQNSMIRRYIAWRNRHVSDQDLRAISKRAKVAYAALAAIYVGVGNPGPLGGAPGYPLGTSRPSPDLYTDSAVKLSPHGKVMWYYQLTPHDLFDWNLQDSPMLTMARGRQVVIDIGNAGILIELNAQGGFIGGGTGALHLLVTAPGRSACDAVLAGCFPPFHP